VKKSPATVFSILETSVFLSSIFKTAVAQNYAVDFVEICKVYIGKMIIKAAKRIFNSDKI